MKDLGCTEQMFEPITSVDAEEVPLRLPMLSYTMPNNRILTCVYVLQAP